MTHTVTITSQGQISIPAKLRRELGLQKKGKAMVRVEDKKLIIEPVKDLLTLRGSLKSDKPPLLNKNTHDLFEKEIAQEAIESLK